MRLRHKRYAIASARLKSITFTPPIMRCNAKKTGKKIETIPFLPVRHSSNEDRNGMKDYSRPRFTWARVLYRFRLPLFFVTAVSERSLYGFMYEINDKHALGSLFHAANHFFDESNFFRCETIFCIQCCIVPRLVKILHRNQLKNPAGRVLSGLDDTDKKTEKRCLHIT